MQLSLTCRAPASMQPRVRYGDDWNQQQPELLVAATSVAALIAVATATIAALVVASPACVAYSASVTGFSTDVGLA